jgi:ribosomal protein S18 acetylase RimI-like enzyme
MIASDWARQNKSFHGPRPLDAGRDLAQVADLIDAAFAADIDEEGQKVLREMRSMSHAGPVLWLLDRTSDEFTDSLGGYVWIEEGRVVGNVSLSRLSPGGNRWQISSVAVAAPYRGRGIARQLMGLALEYVGKHGGGWVLLQAREDNPTALALYQSLGFEAMGGETEMTGETLAVRDMETRQEVLRPAGFTWRGIQAHEWAKEYALARDSLAPLMQWERPVRPAQFQQSALPQWWKGLARRLGGRATERLGVFDQDGQLGASLEVRLDLWQHRAYFRALVARKLHSVVEYLLVREGLRVVPRQARFRVEARFPMELTALREALKEAGFQERRTLIHMRLSSRG